MKKQKLLFLAFAAILCNSLVEAKAQNSFSTQRMNNCENIGHSKNTKKRAINSEKKESGLLNNFFGKKKESDKICDLSGVKAKRAEKHKYISKKNVQNMKEEDVFDSVNSELEAGAVYRAEYISSLGTLIKVDEEIRQTLASTSSTYNFSKKNKKKNEKIVKSKTSSMEDINAAKMQLDAIKKHESAMKEAGEMRKRLAEKTEGVKKNYNQVKKNLKALSAKCNDELSSKIRTFLAFNPNQEAQNKLREEKKALQARKAATRQAKQGRRAESLNKKHGGSAQSQAYLKGMQELVNSKKVLDKQIKDLKIKAMNQATVGFKKSEEFKKLSVADRNKKMNELRRKAQLGLQKRADYVSIIKKKQAVDKKIAEYRKTAQAKVSAK